jgi:hypothetical protein
MAVKRTETRSVAVICKRELSAKAEDKIESCPQSLYGAI